MKYILILVVIIATTVAGFQYGKKSARNTVALEIAKAQRTNGAWNYFDFKEESATAGFLLATQCISGGSSEQTLYLIANSDSEGNQLTTGNDYKLNGADLPSGSWSIAAYTNQKLVKGEAEKSFLTKSMALSMAENTWEAYISPNKKEGSHYIRTGSEKEPMTIVLRIYNPAPELLENIDLVELPTIAKI